MKKIICPSCGKANFEAFVTYPYCAECGSLLPDAKNAVAKSYWQRPVGTLWWISFLGMAAVAIAIGITFLGNTDDQRDQLLVYGIMQRHVYVDSQAVMRLTLDTVVDEGNVLRKPKLKDVELRVPNQLMESWILVSIQPEAKHTFRRGNGTYYELGDLDVNTVIYLTWRPKKVGEYRFNIDVFARKYNPTRYITVTQVDPRD